MIPNAEKTKLFELKKKWNMQLCARGVKHFIKKIIAFCVKNSTTWKPR